MALWASVGTIASTLGGVVGSIFGFKGKQADTLQTALRVLGDTSASNSQREQALASIIVSETTSESMLARNWRPGLMIIFTGFLVSYWFGYVPPNFNEPMSPMMSEIFALIKLGMGGYIGGRTLEKIVSNVGLGKALKTFIEKKLL